MTTQVPTTIYQQLGSGFFAKLTGARNFTGGADYLQMDLPASMTKGKVNKLRITLKGDDTYTLHSYKFSPKTLACPVIETSEGVYCDTLKDSFEQMTGLYCTLNRRA